VARARTRRRTTLEGTWRGEPFGAGLDGGAGNDTVSGGGGNDGDGYNPDPSGELNLDGMDGGPGDDELFGGAGDDDIDERDGPNKAFPTDIDQVFGGDGSEEVNVYDGDYNDTVSCGPGSSAVRWDGDLERYLASNCSGL
jgi:hypothetical protein